MKLLKKTAAAIAIAAFGLASAATASAQTGQIIHLDDGSCVMVVENAEWNGHTVVITYSYIPVLCPFIDGDPAT